MILDPSIAPIQPFSGDAVAAGRKLRILQVIDSLILGGAEQLLVTLARNIDSDHYDLRICSLAPLDEGSPVVRDLRSLGHPVVRSYPRRRTPPQSLACCAPGGADTKPEY